MPNEAAKNVIDRQKLEILKYFEIVVHTMGLKENLEAKLICEFDGEKRHEYDLCKTQFDLLEKGKKQQAVLASVHA